MPIIYPNTPQTPPIICDFCLKDTSPGIPIATLTHNGRTYPQCCDDCGTILSDSYKLDIPLQTKKQVEITQIKEAGIFSLLEEAVKKNASDLFLSTGEPPTLKVNGEFVRLSEVLLTAKELARIIKSILPAKELAKFLAKHDVDMSLDVTGLSRFRINVFRHLNGDSIAIRPLPYKIPTINELMLPNVFHALSHISHGLILCVGPTGSGKSTSLAALLDTINRQESKHIITIEDPIEYIIPNQRSLIHQRGVGEHVASFADGLRSALRENPDIIVVGELRDLETISLAIRAAETGHLVLGTLHCGTASQAITRLIDVFDSGKQAQIKVQLSQSLQAVCAQQLLKRSDRPGMIVATEVLIATLAIRTIIRENRIHEIRGFMETGQSEQMHVFQQSIQNLINQGLVAETNLNDLNSNPVPQLSKAQSQTTKRF